MTVQHFLDTQDLSSAEIGHLLRLIRLLKEADRHGACPRLLTGASLGMIFEEPSTRTRVSFEVAMTKLGGHALYLRPGEIHLGARESVGDTARVLSRMVDGVEMRALRHETVLQFAAESGVPVINGLTDYNHPTQALCDLFTASEERLPEKALSDLCVVFVGDATNVCTSLALLFTRVGATFVHAGPDRYSLKGQWPEVVDACTDNEWRFGGRLLETADIENAVRQADFIYTDLWWWIGQEAEIDDRRAAFMPRYQVSERLLSLAPEHAKVMHCLPAARGAEITDEVIDGPRSIVFEQAENRLHTEKALLTWLLRPRLAQAKEELRTVYELEVDHMLKAPIP